MSSQNGVSWLKNRAEAGGPGWDIWYLNQVVAQCLTKLSPDLACLQTLCPLRNSV